MAFFLTLLVAKVFITSVMSSLLAMSLSMEIIARPETESLSSFIIFIDDLLNVFINFNLLKLRSAVVTVTGTVRRMREHHTLNK